MLAALALLLVASPQETGGGARRSVAMIPGVEHVEGCDFSGSTHVWALGRSDLLLRVRRTDGTVAEDDDSGGGRTPYLALRVEPGAELAIIVEAKDGSPDPVELVIAAAPENASSRGALRDVGAALSELGALQQRGEHERARDRVRTLAAQLDEVDPAWTSGAVALARRNLGLAAWNLGDVETCASLWRASSRHLERTRPPDHLELMKLSGNLGLALMEIGERAEAALLHERVAAVCQRTLPPDHPDVLVALGNLAIVRKETDDLLAAEAIERRLIEAFERRGDEDDPNLLALLVNHGVTLLAMGDLLGARELLERALAGYERTTPPGAHPLLRTRSNLAAVLAGLDELEEARAHFQRVLDEGRGSLPPGHPDLVRAHLNLAGVASRLNDREGSLAEYEELLAVLEKELREDDPMLLAARLNHATFLGELGRRAEAIGRLRDVLEAYERGFAPEHADRMTARGMLLGLLLDEGLHDEAVAQARTLVADMRSRALSAFCLAPREAREALVTDERWLPWLLLAADVGEGRLERVLFELIETRRVVASWLGRGALLGQDDPEIRSLTDRVAHARERLQDLAFDEAGTDPVSRAERLTQLSMERDVAERALRQALIERGVSAETIDADELARALHPGAAAVGYLRCRAVAGRDENGALRLGEDRLIAYAVSRDARPRRCDLGPAAEIEELVEAWRGALGAPSVARGVGLKAAAAEEGDAETRTGERLRRRILDPLLEFLPGVKRLELCADDVVHLVPLDALPLDGGYLGDTVEVVLRSSLASLLEDDAPHGAPARLVALGGVDYDVEQGQQAAPVELALRAVIGERFPPLTGTAREVAALVELHAASFDVPARVLEGAGATKTALRGALPGARFVHLATHGWFASEEQRSMLDRVPVRRGSAAGVGFDDAVTGFAPQTLCGLALAGANRALRGERDERGGFGGVLTAEELVTLDLSSCELAVLSACETNVGVRRAGQGIQSLQSALHAAGARTAITSLWRVDDTATRTLMTRFYEVLWRERLPATKALWQAKGELRAAGHPARDWAGWVLSGDPD